MEGTEHYNTHPAADMCHSHPAAEYLLPQHQLVEYIAVAHHYALIHANPTGPRVRRWRDWRKAVISA
jgi:hypothetical protein